MEQEKILELLHLLNDYQKWFEKRYEKDMIFEKEKEAYRLIKNNIVVDYLYYDVVGEEVESDSKIYPHGSLSGIHTIWPGFPEEGVQCAKDHEEH